MPTATAVAHPNIAFIKYWGNRDDHLRLPANGSISMNLAGLETRTTVTFSESTSFDGLILNGVEAGDEARSRVAAFLDLVRDLAGLKAFAQVNSVNNFPTGAGIASSAAAFAALALAASKAAGLDLGERQLSALARRGSGSACRSVPGGFVEWLPGSSDDSSFASSIAQADHWELADCVAVVAAEPKKTGSTDGHRLAGSSPIQPARVADTPRRLGICRKAILERDFESFAQIVEVDSNLMHAVMMTSTPALFYWEPASLAIIKQVAHWRHNNIPVCYTLDAGPNVHLLCLLSALPAVRKLVSEIPGVLQILETTPAGPARLV